MCYVNHDGDHYAYHVIQKHEPNPTHEFWDGPDPSQLQEGLYVMLLYSSYFKMSTTQRNSKSLSGNNE